MTLLRVITAVFFLMMSAMSTSVMALSNPATDSAHCHSHENAATQPDSQPDTQPLAQIMACCAHMASAPAPALLDTLRPYSRIAHPIEPQSELFGLNPNLDPDPPRNL